MTMMTMITTAQEDERTARTRGKKWVVCVSGVSSTWKYPKLRTRDSILQERGLMTSLSATTRNTDEIFSLVVLCCFMLLWLLLFRFHLRGQRCYEQLLRTCRFFCGRSGCVTDVNIHHDDVNTNPRQNHSVLFGQEVSGSDHMGPWRQ